MPQKLSLEYCQKRLEGHEPMGRPLTLDEVERIRDALYAIAEAALSIEYSPEEYAEFLASVSPDEREDPTE